MHSYPSIYNLGHRYVADLLTTPVNVEEKIDGSQFSFELDEMGELHVRSKGAVLYMDAPEKMFTRAVESVKERKDRLHPGWQYRAEYLAKPKHNTLAYDRVPIGNLIVFDVNTGEEAYLPYEEKAKEAERIGLEAVPLLYTGTPTLDDIRSLLDTNSVLGGQKIEGVVLKPRDYNLWGQDKKVLLGKFVSEAFKEVHGGTWRKSNPTKSDVFQMLATEYTTPARWSKAVQHLQESGVLESDPRDIGLLMREVPDDVLRECRDEIADKLFKYAWPHIKRKLTAGLPEWYKEHLLKKQFE